jgi:hypothetical protein
MTTRRKTTLTDDTSKSAAARIRRAMITGICTATTAALMLPAAAVAAPPPPSAAATAADTSAALTREPTQITLKHGADDDGPWPNGTWTPLRGTLGGTEVSGQTVIIEMKAIGTSTWTRLGTVKTTANRTFLLEFRQRANGVARARFEGDSGYEPSSAEAPLPRVSAGLIGFPATGTSKVGQTLTWTPKVTPSPRKVTLQVATASTRYTTVATVNSAANGTVKLSWKPKKKGKYWVRAVLAGDAKAPGTNTYVLVQTVR